MNRNVVYVIGGVVVAAVFFVAGAFAGPRLLRSVPGMSGLVSPPGAVMLGAPGGAGGPMASLTDEERTQLEAMSDEERRAFFQEKMGGQAPNGRGTAGGPGGARVIEGEILSVDAETIGIKTSSGGSQTVYVDAETTTAYAKGAEQSAPAVGDTVTAVAEQESEGVLSASLLVVE